MDGMGEIDVLFTLLLDYAACMPGPSCNARTGSACIVVVELQAETSEVCGRLPYSMWTAMERRLFLSVESRRFRIKLYVP